MALRLRGRPERPRGQTLLLALLRQPRAPRAPQSRSCFMSNDGAGLRAIGPAGKRPEGANPDGGTRAPRRQSTRTSKRSCYRTSWTTAFRPQERSSISQPIAVRTFITLSGLPSPQSKDPGAWPRGLIVLRLWRSQSVDRSRREAIVDAAADNTVRHTTSDVCPERKSGGGRQKD